MTKEVNLLFLFINIIILFSSCGKNDSITPNVNSSIDPVENLTIKEANTPKQLYVVWDNPDNENLSTVKISCRTKSITGVKIEPITLTVEKGTQSSLTIEVPMYSTYIISVKTYSETGMSSESIEVEGKPYLGDNEEPDTGIFLARADTVMDAMIKLMLTSPRSGVWNSGYPNSTGPYWDGDAVVWGQGGAFSGFVAIREASQAIKSLGNKYIEMDDLMFNGINKFITTDNNISAYAVYPSNGNQRFYDDNVWIGIDMANLYLQTGDTRYLDKAKMVWQFILSGTDEKIGGGVYWIEEENPSSKHTCSTAPSAVLAAKLYLATKEQEYLDKSVELYTWVKEKLQDSGDYLYYDNININGITIDKNKFTYNSGQPMQAASLLYKITNEKQYLTDAQNIARSIFNKWFTEYVSSSLEQRINYIEGHTWFNAVTLRGFIDLYKIDGDRKYITAFEQTFSNLWLSKYGVDESTKLPNYSHILGDERQSSWEVLHVGAVVEILANLALLEEEGL
ncbi:glycoside hydrolase family 76 protein [Plebeiibacterium sediminum]|uniref:Fibronectin type-III domain-containing protein n=1 Tax=Plebeiibacterium sediminum TaxID=2992112 RepID=A0AAE3SGC7_9BACT|nr:glycoside hydrolase family 76 protein [Plebeiobacterium sediminum]MCW3787952.1 hypothetical protein [Plebeiobacterium sediminum]